MNTNAKGSRMELLCLKELTDYLLRKNGDKITVTTWKTNRSRFGANDLFDAWDVGVHLEAPEDSIPPYLTYFVQVKSQFTKEEFMRLKHKRVGDHCYLGVYGSEPQLFQSGLRVLRDFKLPHFYLLKV